MRKFFIPLLAVLLTAGLAMTSCKKDDEENKGGETAETLSLLPAKTTVGTITETSAQITSGMDKQSGEVTEKDILLAKTLSMKCGFCLVEGDGEPTISDTKIDCTESAISSMGKNMTGEFTGLKDNTKYTVRAWATYYDKTFYGIPATFTTPKKPLSAVNVTDPVLSEITTTGFKAVSKIENYETLASEAKFGEIGFAIFKSAEDSILVKAEVSKEGELSATVNDKDLKGLEGLKVYAYAFYGDKVYHSSLVDIELVTFKSSIKLSPIATTYKDGCQVKAQISDFKDVNKDYITEIGFVVFPKGQEPTGKEEPYVVEADENGIISADIHDEALKEGDWSVLAYVLFDGTIYMSEPIDVEIWKFQSKLTLSDISKTYVDGCDLEASISNFKDLDSKLLKEYGFVIDEDGVVPDYSSKKVAGELNENGKVTAELHNDSYKGEKWTVAAYILYDGEYYYSDPKEFETKKEVQIKITLKTPSQANGDIFTNGCKLNGEIEDYYNLNRQGSFGKYGVCYAVDKTPTIDDYTATVTISSNGAFYNNNFTNNDIKYKKITLRAFAVYDGVAYYSEPVEVQTLAFLSTITLSPISKTYSDGCDASASISDFANIDSKTMTESGFCICEQGGEPSTGDIKITVKPTSDGTLATTIHNSGISAGKWAVRAYVIFDGVTYYSEEEDFEIEKVDYGFDVADKKFHYGEHIYVLEEDFDPDNYDPVNVYTDQVDLFVKFSNIPSDYIEFKTVHDEFLGKHITGVIALQVMAFEIYNRDREDGKKCFELINPDYNMNSIMEWVSHRYDQVNPDENQPYLAATFLQGANRDNFWKPTKVDNLYSIKYQADPDGKKQTNSPSRGDVFYVDIIAEGWQTQKVKKCRVVLWEKMIPKGGYYQIHDLSSLVLTAPDIKYDDNSLWEGLD